MSRPNKPAPCWECGTTITPRGGRCKKCNDEEKHRDYQRNRDRRLIEATHQRKRWSDRYFSYVIAIKESSPCTDCGVSYPHYVMDFHHVDDNKERSVSQMRWHTLDKVKAEIEKCILLCANCHRKRTYKERWGGRS